MKMELAKYLSKRLKEVLTEGKWVVGTNFKEQIFDMDWKIAIKKRDNLNTIADLTFHIHYYIDGVTKVFEGGTLDIKDKFSFDSPAINSHQDWRDLVDRFCTDSEKFISLVGDMTEEKLFSNFIDEKYGNYFRNIDLMIEHTYYHLGQLLLIKKRIEVEN